MTKGYRPVGILIYLSVAAGPFFCSEVQADTKYTMVNDYRLYAYSEYRAKTQHNDTLQIRVIDNRNTRGGHEFQGKPLLATDDAFWMEPVPEMLERIFVREFALSFLFRKVGRADIHGGLVLQLALNSFHGHARREGLLGRLISGDVAFSARLLQRKPRKTLFAKDYHSQTSVKLRSLMKSGRRIMAEQIGKSLEEIIPVLISDIEQVLKEMRPPKKTRKPPRRKKPKAINLEPIGPK